MTTPYPLFERGRVGIGRGRKVVKIQGVSPNTGIHRNYRTKMETDALANCVLDELKLEIINSDVNVAWRPGKN
jgi:hypothetical protein